MLGALFQTDLNYVEYLFSEVFQCIYNTLRKKEVLKNVDPCKGYICVNQKNHGNRECVDRTNLVLQVINRILRSYLLQQLLLFSSNVCLPCVSSST